MKQLTIAICLIFSTHLAFAQTMVVPKKLKYTHSDWHSCEALGTDASGYTSCDDDLSDTYVPYAGATAEVDLGNEALITTGTITVGNDLDLTESNIVNGKNIDISGYLWDASGASVSVADDLLPAGSSYDLGSSGSPWVEIWAKDINASRNITGEGLISTAGGSFADDLDMNSNDIDEVGNIDGTDIDITAGTGNFSTSGTITGGVATLDGVDLDDNEKILLGTGDDGEIYGSGDDLYIKNVTSDADVYFQTNDGGVTRTPIQLDADENWINVNSKRVVLRAPETVGLYFDMEVDLMGSNPSYMSKWKFNLKDNAPWSNSPLWVAFGALPHVEDDIKAKVHAFDCNPSTTTGYPTAGKTVEVRGFNYGLNSQPVFQPAGGTIKESMYRGKTAIVFDFDPGTSVVAESFGLHMEKSMVLAGGQTETGAIRLVSWGTNGGTTKYDMLTTGGADWIFKADSQKLKLGASEDAEIYHTAGGIFVLDNTTNQEISLEDNNLTTTGTITNAGTINNVERFTGTDTLDANNEVAFCNGTFTLNLPAGVAGTKYKIANTGTGIITVDGNSAEEVYGATTAILAAGEVINIHYNTTDGWW